MTRAVVTTDIGDEIQCTKCNEFWPRDPEFFYFTKGKPHSWCKACYLNDPGTLAKRERWLTKQAVVRASAREART